MTDDNGPATAGDPETDAARPVLGAPEPADGNDPAPDHPEPDPDGAEDRAATVPDDPAGYDLGPPPDAPEGLGYSAELAERYRGWAHRAGLSQAQARDLHDAFVGELTALHAHAHADEDGEVGAAVGALERAWGPAEAEDYRRQVTYADRAIRALGGAPLVAALKAGGILARDGAVRRPDVAIALARVGERLFAEDRLTEGGPGGRANPFAGETFNLTAQGRLLRDDPDLAARLRAAAGR